MRNPVIHSWLADGFEAQIAYVLQQLGIEDHADDPEAGMVAALELGLSDGDLVRIDPLNGEIVLRTDRAQILHNIATAAAHSERTLSELVESGAIRRADLRDEF